MSDYIETVAVILIAHEIAESPGHYRRNPESDEIRAMAFGVLRGPKTPREHALRNAAIKLARVTCSALDKLGWTRPDA